MTRKFKGLLFDASVLITYRHSNESVLSLASNHIGKCYVLTDNLKEVTGMDISDCQKLGIHVIEPTLGQLGAAAKKRGSLSLQDRLLLIVAAQRGFSCITSDAELRKNCLEEKVSVLWGLEIMKILVHSNAMSVDDAEHTANKIYHSKDRIKREIIDQFITEITASDKI